MRGRLVPGASIGLHTHETSSEIIYIFQGSGKVLYDGEYEPVRTGTCHYCPKGHAHSLINDGNEDLTFLRRCSFTIILLSKDGKNDSNG